MTTIQRFWLCWSNDVLFTIVIAFVVVAGRPDAIAEEADTRPGRPQIHGAIIKAEDGSVSRLNQLRSTGINTAVFTLSSSNDESKEAIRAAAVNAKGAGLEVAYWVEVARSPELAKEHPIWMASLQTHHEWRRYFPTAPEPKGNEVAKTYPWVPILSREPFIAQRERVLRLLANLPAPKLIFLNDLQGAPSACGCGNALCRWTSDYGERRTTVPLGDDAAALFVAAIKKKASPETEIIPVWTTECEEHDGDPVGLCGGVGCFDGICWNAYTRQIMPLAETCKRLAVLALYKEFRRDVPHYGSAEASWVKYAIKTFETMPPRYKGKAVSASRMIAVVQGWDVTAEEIEAQRTAATIAGANGCVVAYDQLDQSWSPKIVPWK